MAYLSPITPALDLTYTYDPIPITGNRDPAPIQRGTAWDFVAGNNNFGIYRHIVLLSGLTSILNDPQADLTLIIPADSELLQSMTIGQIKNMTKSEAYEIINYNILTKKLSEATLESSNCMRLNTRLGTSRLYSTFHKGVLLFDEKAKVISNSIVTNNAIIYIVDKLCIPPSLL